MEKPQENISPDPSNFSDEERPSPRDLVLDKSWSPSPVATLAMGCDADESEEWEEELRKRSEDSSPSMVSPIFPFKKRHRGLTFVSSVDPTEVVEESMENSEDLSTPHYSSSFSVDVPRRPMKERRASSASESGRSCRHLFSSSTTSKPAYISSSQDEGFKHKPEQCHKFVQRLHPIPSDSSQGDDQDGAVKEEELEIKDEPCKNEADQSGHAIKDEPCETKADQSGKAAAALNDCLNSETLISHRCVGEQRHPALFSPNSQTHYLSSSSSVSSHCSDCAKCVSDMVSPLSSPRLSQVKPMSQTIESSPDEPSPKIDDKLHGVSNVTQGCGSKPEIEFSNIPQGFTGELCSAITSMPIQIGDSNLVLKVKEDNMEVEVCMTPSSVDSAASNFTVISGVSPLPMSDPSLHKHHQHKHDHKEHHHHHKHLHEHHKLVGARDNVVTSTPIYKKKVVDDVDVSSITSVPDETLSSVLIPQQSRPRLCTSSDLEFPESPTPPLNGVPALLGPCETADKENLQGSDKENLDPSANKDGLENVDPPATASIPSSPSLASLPIIGRDKDDDASQDMKGSGSGGSNPKNMVNEHGDITSNLKLFFRDTISGAELLERENRSSFASHPKWMRSRSPSPRDLSEEEVADLWETPVNFSDKVWEMIPVVRRASSVDESLFRPQTNAQDSIFSVTLE